MITKTSSAIAQGKLEFMLDSSYTDDSIELIVKLKSDSHSFDNSVDYSEYTYRLEGKVEATTTSTQPYYTQVVPINTAPYFNEDLPVRISIE